jgi:hypothetical protein
MAASPQSLTETQLSFLLFIRETLCMDSELMDSSFIQRIGEKRSSKWAEGRKKSQHLMLGNYKSKDTITFIAFV